eukprot:6688688-Alexandrium_andersonii.AAC.1
MIGNTGWWSWCLLRVLRSRERPPLPVEPFIGGLPVVVIGSSPPVKPEDSLEPCQLLHVLVSRERPLG